MRSRNGMQATDLLDLIDFIKNEEQYSARIKELQDLEARLNSKLEIVNTLEGAEELVQKYQVLKKRIEKERIEGQQKAQKEFKELKEQLLLEHKVRSEELDKKISANRIYAKTVADQSDEVQKTRTILNTEQSQLENEKQQIRLREKQLSVSESKWKSKIVELQKLLERE